MSNTLNIEEIKDKMIAKLEPSGWARVLRGFIYSKDFENVITALAAQSRDGKRFTPPMKDWFRAFEECPYDQLKVVIVGQDPYPQVDLADGISFSCSKTGKVQPSLDYIFKEIERTVYGGYPSYQDPDLKRWSNQGVLLLNTALTTSVGKIGQHYLIWQPFTAYVLDWLSWYNPGMIYIFMGKKASEWADAINDNCYKFHVMHPASASYNSQEQWDSKNVFVEARDIVKKLYNFDLIW